jgi:hypothetical protein
MLKIEKEQINTIGKITRFVIRFHEKYQNAKYPH